jgi:hypothetical protein
LNRCLELLVVIGPLPLAVVLLNMAEDSIPVRQGFPTLLIMVDPEEVAAVGCWLLQLSGVGDHIGLAL